MSKQQIIDKIQAAQALLRVLESEDEEQRDAKHTAMSLLETAKYDLEEYNSRPDNTHTPVA